MSTLINHAKVIGTSLQMRLRGRRGAFSFLNHSTARVFPNVIPPNICEEIRDVIDEVLAGGGRGRIWRDGVGSDSRILQFEKDIPHLLPHFAIAEHVKAIDAYLGKSTYSWLLMANRLVPQKDNKGSGGGLHRDSPFSHQVKCIWYISDVGALNGPFSYVPGTHQNLGAQRHRYPLGVYRFDEISDELEIVTAPAGSLLVCDTRAIHGGCPIVEGTRYAVTLYTFADAEGISRLYRSAGLSRSAA